MKKLVIIMALGAAMLCTSSCRWIHETFYSVEGCTEWYCEKIIDAYMDGDIDKAEELTEHMEEWMKDLDAGEQIEAALAAAAWMENSPLTRAALLEMYGDDDYFDYEDDWY